jgi:hypothetical protein
LECSQDKHVQRAVQQLDFILIACAHDSGRQST